MSRPNLKSSTTKASASINRARTRAQSSKCTWIWSFKCASLATLSNLDQTKTSAKCQDRKRKQKLTLPTNYKNWVQLLFDLLSTWLQTCLLKFSMRHSRRQDARKSSRNKSIMILSLITGTITKSSISLGLHLERAIRYSSRHWEHATLRPRYSKVKTLGLQSASTSLTIRRLKESWSH